MILPKRSNGKKRCENATRGNGSMGEDRLSASGRLQVGCLPGSGSRRPHGEGEAPVQARRPPASEEGLRALEERRSWVRELQLSREKMLARYNEAVPEELEKADGKRR